MRIHCKLNKQVFARDPCFDMLTYYPLQSIIKIPTFTFQKLFWNCLNSDLSPPLLKSVEPIYNSHP